MKEINAYVLDELCNKHEHIMITTQEGVQLSIFIKNGLTFVLLPFGNEVDTPENYGELSSGIVVKPHK